MYRSKDDDMKPADEDQAEPRSHRFAQASLLSPPATVVKKDETSVSSLNSDSDSKPIHKTYLPFPEKLMKVINETADEIVQWNRPGTAFAIFDPCHFEATVLRDHFQSTKYASFTRKLNRWSFRRAAQVPDFDDTTIVFHHPDFQRDRPEMMKEMDGVTKKKNFRVVPASVVVAQAPSVLASPTVPIPQPSSSADAAALRLHHHLTTSTTTSTSSSSSSSLHPNHTALNALGGNALLANADVMMLLLLLRRQQLEIEIRERQTLQALVELEHQRRRNQE